MQRLAEEDTEAIEEIEVTEFKIGPEFLKVMLTATELLEKIARGEITISEAQAIFAREVLPVVEAEREKAVKKRTRRRSTGGKKKSKSKSKTSSKSRKSSKKKKSSEKSSSGE